VANNPAIERLLNQLRSPDETQRREAIIVLGRSNNPQALPLLAEVYQTDDSPELRELARKAGLYLRKNLPAAAPTADADSDDDDENLDEESDEEVVQTIRVKVITKEQEASAKLFLNEAITLNMDNQNVRAVKSLKKALQANPNLADDGYFLGVAGEVLGVDSSEAMAIMMDAKEVQRVTREVKDEEKAQKRDKHIAEVEKFSWGVVIFDLVIYFLIMGIGPILGVLIFAQSFEQLIDMVGQGGAVEMTEEFREMQELADFSGEGFSPIALSIVGITSAVINTLGLMIYYLVLHVIARLMLRGTGTYSYLVYKLTPMFNRYLLVTYFLSYIGTALAIGQGFLPILFCFSLIILIYTLYVGGMVSRRVGETYNFGGMMGCVTVTIAVLILFGIQLGLGILLSGSIAGFLSEFATSAVW
jgi:hypothetical protein